MSNNKQFTLSASNVPQDKVEASPPTLPQADTQNSITFTVQEGNHIHSRRAPIDDSMNRSPSHDVAGQAPDKGELGKHQTQPYSPLKRWHEETAQEQPWSTFICFAKEDVASSKS